MDKLIKVDLSNPKASKEFIENLSDKEIIILNKFQSHTGSYISKEFILREISQHNLGLEIILS